MSHKVFFCQRAFYADLIEHGPSRTAEVAERMGHASPKSAYDVLRRMVEGGSVTRAGHRERTIWTAIPGAVLIDKREQRAGVPRKSESMTFNGEGKIELELCWPILGGAYVKPSSSRDRIPPAV